MAAKPAFEKLLKKFREKATQVSHEDIRARIQAAISEHYESMKGDDEYGPWVYVVAVLGDDKSGDVVYYADGGMLKCSYTLRTTDSKATAKVDCENAVEVAPITNYLPKEAAAPIAITGDVIPLREGAVGQDGSALLKLIAPGWGSSGYYPAAVLERDGPAIFKAGTKNFWNHQTDAEEAARPEGDLRDLASVLTEDARYEKSGVAGPGLYARAKVFEEFRQPVDDLARHIGMSIRATGIAKEGTAEGRKGSIIEKLTSGISVDYVTQAGAGGQVLQLFEAVRAKRLKESANPTEEASMDAAEKERFDKLQEATTKLTEQLVTSTNANRKTQQKLARLESREIVKEKLAAVKLPDNMKSRLVERIVAVAPITTDGDLDMDALTKLVEARIKEAGEDLKDLTGGVLVVGMGGADEPKLTEAEQAAADKQRVKESERLATGLGFRSKLSQQIFAEGVDAFDPEYNAANAKEVA